MISKGQLSTKDLTTKKKAIISQILALYNGKIKHTVYEYSKLYT